MGTYTGRLWLAPHQSEKLQVQILLDEESIRITSNGALIGEWPMAEVEIGHVGNNLHLFVEGETIVIAPNDPELVPALLEPGPPAGETEGPRLGQEQKNGDRPSKKPSRRGAHRADRRMKWTW